MKNIYCINFEQGIKNKAIFHNYFLQGGVYMKKKHPTNVRAWAKRDLTLKHFLSFCRDVFLSISKEISNTFFLEKN